MKVASITSSSELVDRVRGVSRRPASVGAAVEGAISLAMGEPSEGTAPAVVDAAVSALLNGRTRYSPLTGSPTLRGAIADHLETRHRRHLSSENVVCTHGATAGLAATVLALVDPGDRVVIPEPTYSLYADHVALAGGEVNWVANGPDGSLDVEAVLGALGGARMLLLCTPGNPLGTLIDRSALTRISDAARQTGTFVVVDEAYSDIVFDGRQFFSSLDLPDSDHVITCQTFSKSYAMTGWRIGYVVAAQHICDQVNLVHRTLNGSLATFVQDAALQALRTPASELSALADSYQKRRDMVVAELSGISGVHVIPPEGAFYAFVRVDGGLSADELVARLASAGVLVRSGTEYGPSGEGCFRISFAADTDDLRTALARIRTTLEGISR